MFKKVYNDVVDVFDGETLINTTLIFKGLLKVDQNEIKDHENRENILAVEEELRKERI
jgi:hypothetical protein